MRVLVTGASGFLGARLVDAAAAAGYDVRALVRKTSKVQGLPPAVELVYGDLRDVESLLVAMEGCQAVLHAGAAVGSWLPDSSTFYKVNVQGLKNVLEAVKRTPGVERLVYTSSFFAVGPSPANGRVVDEGQTHSGKDFASDYEKSKYQADQVARDAAKGGVNIVMLYPGIIYGPGAFTAGNFLADLLIERFNGRLPGYPGRGQDRHSLCHVEDVVMGHLAALEKGRAGERYFLTGDVHSIRDVLDLAAELTSTSPPRLTLPLGAMTLFGYVSMGWARLTGRKPVVTPQAVAIMRRQWVYTSAKAERELGYKSRPFKDGLAEVLAWLKDLDLIKY